MLKTNLKSIVIATALTGSLLFAGASSAFAQTATPSPRGAAACSTIAGRITTAITNSQTNQAKVTAVIAKYDAFLTSHTASFQAKYGMAAFNTLAADFSTLHNTYGTQIVTDWTTFTSDLTNVQNMSNAGNCGTTNGLFRTQLNQTISDRAKVKKDVEAYRDYVNNTIKVFIHGLTPVASASPIAS